MKGRVGDGLLIFVIFTYCFWISQVFSNTGDILSWTWVQEEAVIEIQPEVEILEVPDFKITFQNPSYVLEREEERSDYTCDSEKEECKINFKLQTSDDTDIWSTFICSINFWFESDQSSKCNPNTVIFPEWETSMAFRVSDKNDENNYKEKTILIKKEIILNEEPELEEPVISSWSIETSTGTIETQTWSITNSGVTDSGTWELILEVPSPIIDIQSGLEYSGNWEIWNCKKEDCKMNLTAVNTFTWDLIESDYKCLWDFWWGMFTTSNTDKKCNPWYVTYGTGSFEVILKIYEKWNESSFTYSQITVHNVIEIRENNEENNTENGETFSWSIVPEISWWWGGWWGWSSVIVLKEILIQSGLDENNTCNDERCKVNLQYENTSKETCEWNFWNAEFNEKYTTTCNPGFIYFSPWEDRVSVRVSENGMLKWEKYLDVENIFLKIREQNNLPPRSIITLQWRLSEKKFLIDNSIVCRDVERCYINFTWEESIDPNGDKLTYEWNLWNGRLFHDKNPKGVWYRQWKYSVSLKVRDIFGVSHENSFSIEVIGDENKNTNVNKEEENIIEEEILKSIEYFRNLKIKSVLVNPKWKDSEAEYIELENTGFTSINIRWVTLDDILEKWSKPFIIKEGIILGAFQSYKIYREDSKIVLNNGSDEVHIWYYWEELDSISWDFSIPDDYALTKKDTEFLEYSVKVLRVVDGDTLLIQLEDERVEKLRLVWVDTPETKHPKKPVEFFWKEASNFTKQMLEWKQVILKQSVKNYRDKYNRLLGYVYLYEEEEEIFFNKLLIEQGYARAYLRFPFEYSLDFKKAENKAKKDKQWMWALNEVRKEILSIAREEKKLEIEAVSSYQSFWSIKDIKVWAVIGNIQEKKENLHKRIEEVFTKKYTYFSQVWSEETAKKIKKKLPSQKKEVWESVKQKKKISFTKTVVKQKKSLKISGKTLPNSKIRISWMGEDIVLTSDSDWKYTKNISTGLESWEYNLSFSVENNNGEVFAINRDKKLILESEYLQNMKKYYLSKPVKKKGKKTKIEEPKKDDPIEESSLANENNMVEQESNFSLLIANIITILVVIWLLFLILRKEKII